MLRGTVWERNLKIINDKYYDTESEILLLFTGCFKIEKYNRKLPHIFRHVEVL